METDRMKRLKAAHAKNQEKSKKRRDEFVEAMQPVVEEARENQRKIDQWEKEKYEKRLVYLKGCLKKSGGIFRKLKYTIEFSTSSNPLDGRGGWEFFGEFLRISIPHRREWDHKPSDEEIYDLIYEVYGKPKYLTRDDNRVISITLGSKPMGMMINGEYHKFEKEEDSDLTVEDALKKL